ncbi:MAG: glycosyltransferase family 39 protein [Candidatus Omnitrophica bacterium]|nr:glycosyltransferase family 39 protein [Candidatus Omnitrophota bacterium]
MMNLAGLLLGVLVLYAAYSSGRFLLSRAGFDSSDPDLAVLAPAAGLGCLSMAVLALGLAGLLKPGFLWLLLLPGLLIFRDPRGDWNLLRRAGSEFGVKFSGSRLALAAAGAVAVAVAAGLLAPETANDSLCYHVHLPKLFLKAGRIFFIPHEFNSLFPFFMEMLYTFGLGTQGMALAKFFHFAAGLLAAGGVWITARRLKAGRAASVAALIFFTTPGFINQLGTTYVEGGQAAFTVLSLYALLRWSEAKEGKWLVLAGIFSGWLLGIKYLGLIPILGYLLFLAWECRAGRGRDSFPARMLLFLSCAAAVSAYWYLRSWVQLGNPVYPYFYSVFGAGDPTIHYDDIGVPKTIASFLAVPWTMTMHPEKFEGFGVQLGPAYLALLPAAYAMGGKKMPRLAFLTLFSLLYLVCWFFLGQSLRFLMPLLPVLAVILAGGMTRLEEEGLGRPLQMVLAVIFAVHAGLAFYHYRGDFRVALGLETRDRYLEKRERTYPAAQFVKTLEPNAKILAADEAHLFYFERDIVRERVYAMRSRYADGADSVEEVLSRLKKAGFTHLLFVDSPQSLDVSGLETFSVPRLAREREKELASFLEPLYTKQVKDLEGRPFVYRLYRIQIPTP